MDHFDFNTLNDEHRNDLGEGTTSAGSADLALTGATESLDALDGGNTGSTDTPALTSSTGKGKHGKKHHDEPAPAPAVEPVVGDVGDVDLSTPLAPTHDENKGFMRYLRSWRSPAASPEWRTGPSPPARSARTRARTAPTSSPTAP